MKSKSLLIISLVLIGSLMVLPMSVMAQGTSSGTAINNTATVTAANVPSATSAPTVSTNVQTIAGAYYTTIPSDATAAPGSTTKLIFQVVNWGNAADTFNIGISNTQGVFNGTWSESVSPSSVNLAAGANTTFTLIVTPDATATNNSYKEYRVGLVSANAATAVKKGRYQGDNGNWYGGDMGLSWDGSSQLDDGVLRHGAVVQGTATTNLWIRVTITGPVLQISKSIVSVQLGGASSVAIPGATINYRVYVTNVGSSGADNVIIKDDYDEVNTTYVAGSAAVSGSGSSGFTAYESAGVVYATNMKPNALPNGTAVALTYSVTIN